jgi:hypothetical protein
MLASFGGGSAGSFSICKTHIFSNTCY